MGWQHILLIVLLVMLAILIVLYFLGKKAQKKKEAQDEQIAAAAQSVTMLIIDKKRMRLKDAGLPQQVIEQTPKLMRRSKLPIVKAKVNVNPKGRNAIGGSKIMTLVSDAAIFDTIPVKKEVKAVISGIYIMEVKGVRGPLETPQKKQGFWKRMKSKISRKNK